ncbi:hypothetical protein [Methylacidimicrobium sp. B4]|uniref:hypothetical protein n=1 Tax=Methylacidimicrobium sp. B4 TaxID=2796139 RepID=UPI000466736F|nr:hypothetical protein [Methylacidimicrobium sp. B4]QSR85479.1 hypothetical protein MacB4_04400 [Methylacidimicrobium sp. B4]
MDWPQAIPILGGLAAVISGIFPQINKRFEQLDKRIDDWQAQTSSRFDRLERLLEAALGQRVGA